MAKFVQIITKPWCLIEGTLSLSLDELNFSFPVILNDLCIKSYKYFESLMELIRLIA